MPACGAVVIAPHQLFEGSCVESAQQYTAALDPAELTATQIESIESHPRDRELGGSGAGEEGTDQGTERWIGAIIE
jgi:hypothetical protein